MDEDDLKAIIRGMLISNPNSMTVRQLSTDFRNNEGMEVPYAKLGYPSFIDYLQSIPDTVVINGYSNNAIVTPVKSKLTSHIDSLVMRQKPTSKHKSPFRPQPSRRSTAVDTSKYNPQYTQPQKRSLLGQGPGPSRNMYPTPPVHRHSSMVRERNPYNQLSFIRPLMEADCCPPREFRYGRHFSKVPYGNASQGQYVQTQYQSRPSSNENQYKAQKVDNNSHEKQNNTVNIGNSNCNLEKNENVNSSRNGNVEDVSIPPLDLNILNHQRKELPVEPIKIDPNRDSYQYGNDSNKNSGYTFVTPSTSYREAERSYQGCDLGSYSPKTSATSVAAAALASNANPAVQPLARKSTDFQQHSQWLSSNSKLLIPAGAESTMLHPSLSDSDNESSHLHQKAHHKNYRSNNVESQKVTKDNLEDIDEGVGSMISSRMRKNLSFLISQYPDGIFCCDLPRLYEKQFKCTFDYEEYKYDSVYDMVCDLEAIFTLRRDGRNGDYVLYSTEQVKNDPAFADSFKKLITRETIEKVCAVLNDNARGLPMSALCDKFWEFHRRELDVRKLGFDSVESLINSMSEYVHKRKVKDKILLYMKTLSQEVSMNDLEPQHQEEDTVTTELPSALPDDSKLSSILTDMYPEEVCGPNDVYKMPELPKLDEDQQFFEISVSEVMDPFKFWVQLHSEFKKLDSMMVDLDDFYTKEEHNYQMLDMSIKPGQVCCCPYSGKWHRVVVLNSRSALDVRIEYVDYGTVCVVPKKQLRFLHKDFLELPMQAIRAKLASILPPNGLSKWPDESCRLLLSMVSDKRLVMEACHIDYENLFVEGVLYDTNEEDVDIVINDELVNRGCAMFVLLSDDEDSEGQESNETKLQDNMLSSFASEYSKASADNIVRTIDGSVKDVEIANDESIVTDLIDKSYPVLSKTVPDLPFNEKALETESDDVLFSNFYPKASPSKDVSRRPPPGFTPLIENPNSGIGDKSVTTRKSAESAAATSMIIPKTNFKELDACINLYKTKCKQNMEQLSSALLNANSFNQHYASQINPFLNQLQNLNPMQWHGFPGNNMPSWNNVHSQQPPVFQQSFPFGQPGIPLPNAYQHQMPQYRMPMPPVYQQPQMYMNNFQPPINPFGFPYTLPFVGTQPNVQPPNIAKTEDSLSSEGFGNFNVVMSPQSSENKEILENNLKTNLNEDVSKSKRKKEANLKVVDQSIETPVSPVEITSDKGIQSVPEKLSKTLKSETEEKTVSNNKKTPSFANEKSISLKTETKKDTKKESNTKNIDKSKTKKQAVPKPPTKSEPVVPENTSTVLESNKREIYVEFNIKNTNEVVESWEDLIEELCLECNDTVTDSADVTSSKRSKRKNKNKRTKSVSSSLVSPNDSVPVVECTANNVNSDSASKPNHDLSQLPKSPKKSNVGISNPLPLQKSVDSSTAVLPKTENVTDNSEPQPLNTNKKSKKGKKGKKTDIDTNQSHTIPSISEAFRGLGDWSDLANPYKPVIRLPSSSDRANAIDCEDVKVVSTPTTSEVTIPNINVLPSSTDNNLYSSAIANTGNIISEKVINDKTFHIVNYEVSDTERTIAVFTDELIKLFTSFSKRNSVIKALDCKQVKKPFFDIAKKDLPQLFSQLESYSIEGIVKRNNSMPEKINVLPLDQVPELLGILKIDQSIVGGFQLVVNEFCS